MNVIPFSNRKVTVSAEPVLERPQETPEADLVQEAIGRLQDEVRWLQAELARTRRALEQRQVLLRNSQLRERELCSEVGAR